MGATIALVSLAVVTVGFGSPAHASPSGPTIGQRAAEGSAEVYAAMQRDLGLTTAQAKQRAADQANAIETDRTLKIRLGAAYSGSWFDASAGRLVVDVTDTTSAARVSSAGAQARVVTYGRTRLEGIKTELDAFAGKAPSSATRSVKGARQPAVAGLTSWYVDTKTDSVVVTAVRGKPSAAALTNLTKYGSAVHLQYVDRAPTSTANFMDGGDLINGSSCSAGFNLRNPSTGQGFLLTAGHCVSAGSTLTGQGGVTFGPVLASFFPTYDDSLTRNDNPGFWIQGPWVDVNPSNGGVITISGFTDSPVGTTVCKSGIRTELTCGSILAKNETVTFDGVNTVFGETRHSACVRKGDSGGSNFAVLSSYTAEGVTSGAVLYGADLQCGANVGQPTISWYFPIANSLSFYGPAYGVQLF
jgi:streptogrisin C